LNHSALIEASANTSKHNEFKENTDTDCTPVHKINYSI
jgi:hypothetical protein